MVPLGGGTGRGKPAEADARLGTVTSLSAASSSSRGLLALSSLIGVSRSTEPESARESRFLEVPFVRRVAAMTSLVLVDFFALPAVLPISGSDSSLAAAGSPSKLPRDES